MRFLRLGQIKKKQVCLRRNLKKKANAKCTFFFFFFFLLKKWNAKGRLFFSYWTKKHTWKLWYVYMYGHIWNMKYRLIFNEAAGISTAVVSVSWIPKGKFELKPQLYINKISKHILSITESSFFFNSLQATFLFCFFFSFFENGKKNIMCWIPTFKAYARDLLRQTYFFIWPCLHDLHILSKFECCNFDTLFFLIFRFLTP